MKLHLPARVPNEGARKLARWIMRRCGGDLVIAERATRVSATAIQRVVTGEMVPATEHARDLGSCADVDRREWRHAPRGGWFDVVTA